MNAMTGMRGVAAAGGDKQKFKVGDRVRVHGDPYFLALNNRAGLIEGRAHHRHRGDWLVNLDNQGGSLTFLESEMTLLPPFAAGDRVRIKSGPNNSGFGEIGDIGVVDTVEHGNVYMKFEAGARAGESWWISPEHLEPAPLRIEAGKTYVTADGTRVGPMKSCGIDEFTADGGARIYRPDGKRIFGGEPTLVAEAPALTKGNPAAQVDNLADEYGGGEAKPKFKVGDRVECRGQFSFDPSIGTVVGFAESGLPYVSIDGRAAPFLEKGWCYQSKQLRLVAPATSANPTTLIVALLENGQPKPATRPYVHRSREAAATEAARLAGKHTGQEFGVFELVDTRKVERTYEHEWQRLAAEGKFKEAARCLKDAVDIPLQSAKSAVDYWLCAAA